MVHALLLAILMVTGPTIARSEEPVLVLSGAGAGSIEVMQRVCLDDDLYVHHNGSFESGFAWQYEGVVPPYDGAFGEAFDLGAGRVSCMSVWVSQDGTNMGQGTDVYVWVGGVDGTPGLVLGMVGNIIFQDIPIWPDGGRYDVEIPVSVPGQFTVGSWGNWPGARAGYGWLADVDGPEGYPWTHVAEGTGVPSGWQHPDVIFGTVTSMGIGVHFVADGTPVVPATWSGIKHLFAGCPCREPHRGQ